MKLPDVYWNSTNALLEQYVAIGDAMDIVCPFYDPDVDFMDTEQSIIYRVSNKVGPSIPADYQSSKEELKKIDDLLLQKPQCSKKPFKHALPNATRVKRDWRCDRYFGHRFSNRVGEHLRTSKSRNKPAVVTLCTPKLAKFKKKLSIVNECFQNEWNGERAERAPLAHDFTTATLPDPKL
ncbi:hypothetical protein RB195_002993 [Necator americanus]|uniref:Ephrin RBD domain-containing protein n=1 Tax=Necator americanus TaxID=51031 RepID=A0ABR1DLL0_NECAM